MHTLSLVRGYQMRYEEWNQGYVRAVEPKEFTCQPSGHRPGSHYRNDPFHVRQQGLGL